MERAREILKEMYIKEHFSSRKKGVKKYLKLTKKDLILFSIQLLDTIEKNKE